MPASAGGAGFFGMLAATSSEECGRNGADRRVGERGLPTLSISQCDHSSTHRVHPAGGSGIFLPARNTVTRATSVSRPA